MCIRDRVTYGSVQRTGEMDRKAMARARAAMAPYDYETVYQPPMPVGAYALAATRHMYE